MGNPEHEHCITLKVGLPGKSILGYYFYTIASRTCQKCRREIEEQCEEKTINKCDEVPREVCEDKVTNVTSYETVPVCKKVRDI